MTSPSARTVLGLLVSSALVSLTVAFAPLTTRSSPLPVAAPMSPPVVKTSNSLLVLHSSNEKKKGGLDADLRTKLVAESIAPWRTLRLFLYAALGSGAFIGGMITLTGTIAAVSGAKPDVDLNAEYLNLAIDFGAVAAFALLAKFDLGKKEELDEKVEQKMERKREQKEAVKGMREREKMLGTLKLNIQVSADGATQEAAVKELQAGARQHMIVVVGPRKACRDALVGANLLKMDFAMSNVLVVPYETDAEADAASRPDGSGFGALPIYETQPYVARPTGDGWDEYAKMEMDDAIKQNGEKSKEEGIAIVVASNGKVIRRGVGKVPWRQMVEQLEESVSGKKSESGSLF